jgi:putative solute:sodium symporter small subunit
MVWEAVMSDQISPEAGAAHWAKTRTLMWICLAIWAIFSFVIHIFVGALNEISFLGFPLGFYMAAQGSLIVFVVLTFWYVARQNAIDEELGAAED